MKIISLTKTQLRLLTMQLESKGDGFSLVQLRQLNKVVGEFEKGLDGFSEKLDKIITTLANEPDKQKEEVDTLIATEGKKNINIELEDAEYDFVKESWSSIPGFFGRKEVREIVLAIDDALKNPSSSTKA